MTSPDLSRRTAVFATLASSLLAACGSGGGGSGSSTVRAINLTSDLSSLDLYIGGTKQFSALATGVLASYIVLDANTYTVNVNVAGNVSTLFTNSYTYSKDAHFTTVVWGPQAALRVSNLPEDYDTTVITTGNAKLRVLNATGETGAVDVFFTAPGADLTAGPALIANVPSGSLTGFFDIAAGTGTTYELRITSQGNPNDVRLTIDNLALTAGNYQTLVVTAGTGATLVSAQLIVQQGTTTPLINPQARIRFVSSLDSNASASVTVGTTQLSPGPLVSSAQQAYTTVTAGNVTLATTINGVLSSTTPTALTLASGTDYTLLVYGPPGQPAVVQIVDDNRLPLIAGRTKIRVVNGVDTIGAVTMTVDNVVPVETSYVAPGANLANGANPSYALIASNSLAHIKITSASDPTKVYYQSPSSPGGDLLVSQAVYTLYVLTGAAGPQGMLLRDTA